jgi:hypothetical protein
MLLWKSQERGVDGRSSYSVGKTLDYGLNADAASHGQD